MTSATQGWVFFCNKSTEEECFRQSIVGSADKYLPRLKTLKPGDPVLLYNLNSEMIVGHFTALSEARLDFLQEEWIKRYRAQVQLKLEERFAEPIPLQKLESIPDLYFDSQGFLTNFSLPIEVVQKILDLVVSRKKSLGEPAIREDSNFRKKFPPNLLSSDGHRVRSKAELLIDNWLYTRRPPIAHAYERRLPVPEEVYADFYIPLGDCYIEYWGLDTPEYTNRQRKKMEIFEKYEFRVISLGEPDIEKLDDLLPGILLKFLPSGYRFQ